MRRGLFLLAKVGFCGFSCPLSCLGRLVHVGVSFHCCCPLCVLCLIVLLGPQAARDATVTRRFTSVRGGLQPPCGVITCPVAKAPANSTGDPTERRAITKCSGANQAVTMPDLTHYAPEYSSGRHGRACLHSDEVLVPCLSRLFVSPAWPDNTRDATGARLRANVVSTSRGVQGQTSSVANATTIATGMSCELRCTLKTMFCCRETLKVSGTLLWAHQRRVQDQP